MSTTLSQLRTQVYAILREEEDSSAYPYTLIDAMINSAQQRICSGKIVNSFTGNTITKGNLPFLEERKFYSNILSTTISTTVATLSDITLYVNDTTDFPTTGYLWIQGDIVTYTGVTATTFTGVTGLSYLHESGTAVYPAFAMPTDYMSTIEVSYNNSIPIPYKASKQIYRDSVPMSKGYSDDYINTSPQAFPYQPPFYTIWAGTYFLPFWIDNSTGFFTLHYEKVPTSLTTGASTSTISNDIYALNTIPYLAVGEVLFNRGEEGRASSLLTFAYGQISEMYSFFNNQSAESMDGQSVTTEKQYLNL